MYKKNKLKLLRTLAVVLVLALALPMGVSAAEWDTAVVQPRASYYLNSYSAYVYPAGGGLVQVCYSVTGTDYMDEIGAMRITLYESTNNSTWTQVKTFTSTNYTSMMDYDDYYHSGYLNYRGVAGRYYKAYVCVWAGKDGGGDNRYFWTSVKKAT